MHFLKLSADLQNPSALDSKVLLDFDHVKNSLKVDDEGQLQIIFLFLSFFFFLGVNSILLLHLDSLY